MARTTLHICGNITLEKVRGGGYQEDGALVQQILQTIFHSHMQ
jgi:hypothetical protein